MASLPFTTALIASLRCQPGCRKWVVRDLKSPGLSVEVRGSGGKTWYCTYTTLSGQRRQLRLGPFPGLSLNEARNAAAEVRLRACMGHDLCAQQQQRRREASIEHFVQTIYLPHIQVSKKSWRDDQRILKLYILPSFADVRLSQLSHHQICHWRGELIARGLCHGTVNRYLSTLRHLYTIAIRLGHCPQGSHPLAHISPLPYEPHRQHCLTQGALTRLLTALRASHNTQLLAICTLLLLTGAQKREVLDARWEHVNLERHCWTIPVTKSGRSHSIPLSKAACNLLASLQASANTSAFVFPSPRTGAPFRSIHSAWHQARTAAGLPRLRIHDLRHSFASTLINSRTNLYTVQRLLGHTSPRITQRYATLNSSTLLTASELVATWVEQACIQ